MTKLSLRQKETLRSLQSGRMQLANDPVRDELVALGLVEMKLGGWGLTAEGRRRVLLG
jgi:hypothetical protein